MRPLAIVLAICVVLALPAASAQPTQVHASLDGTGIAIAWARPGDPASASVADAVQWGRGGTLDQAVTDVAVTIVPPGTAILSARLPLQSGDVQYRVGSEANGWSAVFNLSVPSPAEPWRIAVYGDHGTGADSEFSVALVPLVAEWRPHLVLHAGDLAYADGTASVWDTWFGLVEPIAANTLYMAAPGNHEHEGYGPASGPDPASAPAPGALTDPYHQFRGRFNFPGSELSYSFDAGPLHVLVLNSEDLCLAQPVTFYVPWRASPACDPGTSDMALTQETPPNQALLDFARDDLEAHATSPWTFVLLHRPPYTSGSYQGERILQDHYAPLFEAHGVDLVLSGHDHNYQRSYPLRGGVPDSTQTHDYPSGAAPIYIVSGGGGEGLYALTPEAPTWAAMRAMEYHHVRLEVTATALRGQVIATASGDALDNFTIGDWPAEGAPSGTPGNQTPALQAPWLVAAVVFLVFVLRRIR